MCDTFRVFFRRKRQFFTVYLHDVHPSTFKRNGGGRWGYFVKKWDNPKEGLFGEIHLVKSRVRVDSVSHEIDHLRCEWMFANGRYVTIKVRGRKTLVRGKILTGRNEEWYCRFGDELTRHFWREYKRFIDA